MTNVQVEDDKTMLKRLPKGWECVPLKDVIEDAQPGFACGERDVSGIVQLRMNNVNTNGSMVWDEYIRVPVDRDEIQKYELKLGDVLFNNTNSVELVGKTALFRGHTEPVVYSNHFTRLRPVKARLDAEYLSYWLVLLWKKKSFENLCNRWIGQSAVKNDKLLSLKIPLPPLREQKRIVAILNGKLAAVGKAKAAAEVQLDIINSLPASILRLAFDGEL